MTIYRALPRLRSVVAVGSLLLALTALAAPTAVAAPAAGWLRLAHLSPNTPPVDVYLYNFGDPAARTVLKHVAYGTVSAYLPVKAGQYTVAMRSEGAAATAAPVLSTTVTVRAGNAYTVAGMGPLAGLRLVILHDTLTAPSGRSLIRVIQASMRQQVVTVKVAGRVLTRSLAFAAVTSYHAVTPGILSVAVAGTTESTTQQVTMPAGGIRTIAVLDEHGKLGIVSLVDAAGSGTMPTGAPGTGFGGTAPRPGQSPAPWLAVIGIGALTALAGLARLRRAGSPAPRRVR